MADVAVEPVLAILPPMSRTLAEHLGSTPHVSPLLHKARRLGLTTPDSLLRLAVRRGCTHYAPPDYDPARVSDPGRKHISDLELAIALCSSAQQYDPKWVRCGAQLLGSEEIEVTALVRAARMERCEAVIRHIAEAAIDVDTGREAFWRSVLAQLPVRRTPPRGVLPHASRFMLQSGITGPRRPAGPRSVWLRPRKQS